MLPRVLAMALVQCPDCGRKVSDQAEACPACAHPVARKEAETKSIAVGAAVVPSRVRERRGPAKLVVLETAALPAPSERRSLETHRGVCHRGGGEEIFLYRPSATEQHLCGDCEQDELVAHVDRSRVLHWWPLALLVVLLGVAVVGVSLYAGTEHKAPRDPVIQ
jgi:hypothetical protein